MDRKWLVRLTNKDILGPYDRDEVLKLIHDGELKNDDEVCSGNGYWFALKETELVEKFVSKGELQPFNPVSEATTLFADSSQESLDNLDGLQEEKDDVTQVVSVDEVGEDQNTEKETPPAQVFRDRREKKEVPFDYSVVDDLSSNRSILNEDDLAKKKKNFTRTYSNNQPSRSPFFFSRNIFIWGLITLLILGIIFIIIYKDQIMSYFLKTTT